jgi:dihydropteroate synthase
MGIVNVTPDSFSDGGQWLEPAAAIARGIALVEAGADVLDVGGESTRPGYVPVMPAEQIARVVPVIEGLRAHVSVPISIDTTHAIVARAALDAGADWINDTTALHDDVAMADLAAERDAHLVLMHRFEPPRTAGSLPTAREFVRTIARNLAARVDLAVAHGVARMRCILDPGIGFGTTPTDAVALHVFVDELAALGLPLLFGPSRKSFLGAVAGCPPGQREFATAASVTLLASAGVDYVRVHDVHAMRGPAALGDAVRELRSREGDS